MAEFPPNLDDGELYLPSDIFLNENHCSCMNMDNLAHNLSTLSLLQPHQTQTPPNFERFKQPVGSGSVKSMLLPQCYGVNGGVELGQRLYGYGNGPNIHGSDPFYEYQYLKQTQTQVDRYLELEARARVLQQQRQHLLQNRLLQLQNRGLPFQGGSGFVRESGGGTGVFHPRIVSKRKQAPAPRNRQESQATQQRNSIKRASINKHKDCYYHLPPEMGLPRDWTY